MTKELTGDQITYFKSIVSSHDIVDDSLVEDTRKKYPSIAKDSLLFARTILTCYDTLDSLVSYSENSVYIQHMFDYLESFDKIESIRELLEEYDKSHIGEDWYANQISSFISLDRRKYVGLIFMFLKICDGSSASSLTLDDALDTTNDH